MHFYKKLFFTFFTNFFFQYFIFSAILLHSLKDFTHNMSKLYIAFIVGLVMTILDLIIHSFQYNTLHFPLFFSLVFLLCLFVFFYKTQFAVNYNDYLKQIKENNSTSLLISNAINAKNKLF